MTTPPPNLPLPRWRRLPDGWHVELVRGANRTRCNAEISAKRLASDKSMPTHCNLCRLHYRAAVKAQGEVTAKPPASPDLVAEVLARMGDLHVAVAKLRAKQGRDAVRALDWGTTLDAMDSGRTELHHDDQVRAVTDRMFIRWLLGRPVHQREELMRRVMDKAGPVVICPSPNVVVVLDGGELAVLRNGMQVTGRSWDQVLYTGGDCDPDWLRTLPTRFNDAELGTAWLASLDLDGEPEPEPEPEPPEADKLHEAAAWSDGELPEATGGRLEIRLENDDELEARVRRGAWWADGYPVATMAVASWRLLPPAGAV